MNEFRPILRALGSLWFAAVLLMLLLVAMACATVYESTHGTAQALERFYRSAWFEALLVLVCVNVAAAVLARYPFNRKQAGFVITHAAIVLTLVGALITEQLGVDGQVGIAEGQRVERFSIPSQDALTIVNPNDRSQASIALDSPAFRKDHPVDQPEAETLTFGDARISVQRYFPDSLWSREVLAGDDPSLKPAIEVSLATPQQQSTAWVFPDGHPATLGSTSVSFRLVSSATELARLLSEGVGGQSDATDLVRVTCGGETFEIPREQCQDQPAAVGETDYTVRVLRYLPHATVGSDNKLTNASSSPVNPAIEVEIAGPLGKETRIAFARFPTFSHGKKQFADVELTFVSGSQPKPAAPLEILGGPDGRMYARFQHAGGTLTPQELQLATPIDTSQADHQLTVLRRLEHARVEWSLTQHGAVRDDPEPGLLVEIQTPEHTEQMWVQKQRPRSVRIGGTPYELTYGARQLPLGFGLTLNSFRIGTYPGGERPRSFESQIATEDPVTGRTQNHVISMNHPATVGGYTLYQSSYSQSGTGPAISYLSVSRDPGKPVVFAGYIALMIGMLMVLWTRIAERRAKPGAAPNGRTSAAHAGA